MRRPVPGIANFPVASVAEMLGGVPIFSELPDRHLRSLAKELQIQNAEAGRTIVKHGEGGVGFYIVLSGEAEVRKGSRRLATLTPGQFFGEMSLLDGGPRSADVVATQPSVLGVLSRWEFVAFADTHSGVYPAMLKECARRLRETDQKLSE